MPLEIVCRPTGELMCNGFPIINLRRPFSQVLDASVRTEKICLALDPKHKGALWRLRDAANMYPIGSSAVYRTNPTLATMFRDRALQSIDWNPDSICGRFLRRVLELFPGNGYRVVTDNPAIAALCDKAFLMKPHLVSAAGVPCQYQPAIGALLREYGKIPMSLFTGHMLEKCRLDKHSDIRPCDWECCRTKRLALITLSNHHYMRFLSREIYRITKRRSKAQLAPVVLFAIVHDE